MLVLNHILLREIVDISRFVAPNFFLVLLEFFYIKSNHTSPRALCLYKSYVTVSNIFNMITSLVKKIFVNISLTRKFGTSKILTPFSGMVKNAQLEKNADIIINSTKKIID